MRIGNWLLVLLALTLLGTVVLAQLLPAELRPDLFAVALVFLCLRARRDRLMPTAWLTGLLKDVVMGSPLGASALLYLAFAMVILRIRRMLNTRRPGTRVILAFAIAFLGEGLLLLPAALRSEWGLIGDAVLKLTMVSAMTAGLAPLVVWVLDAGRGWLGMKRWMVFGVR